MEWSPDPAVERERVERKAAARKQQEQFLTRMMVSKLIQEIVEITPSSFRSAFRSDGGGY